MKRLAPLLPRYALLVLFRAYILPILDYGDVIYDNCTSTDSQLLENIQTDSAKLILGCFKTTSHDKVLAELSLSPLFLRGRCHILITFRNILFGPCPSFLSNIVFLFFKYSFYIYIYFFYFYLFFHYYLKIGPATSQDFH